MKNTYDPNICAVNLKGKYRDSTDCHFDVNL